jgi:hypothetical protein
MTEARVAFYIRQAGAHGRWIKASLIGSDSGYWHTEQQLYDFARLAGHFGLLALESVQNTTPSIST